MLARLQKMPLGLALVCSALISVAAFALLHHAVKWQASPVGPIPVIVTDTVGLGAPKLSTPFEAKSASVSSASLQSEPQVARQSVQPIHRRSQLIRSASITIQVGDVARALQNATTITDEQLGDVIGLNDETPDSQSAKHVASMQIRVPQSRFLFTLDSLANLGKLRSKTINAQDVSDQLIDSTARLRNLRRTELDILNIMDRSGNIEQVLDVTQQLSAVREQIETLDAQVKNMQYQVAYSSINITFVSPTTIAKPTSVALLRTAWHAATQALRAVTIALLSSLLWLVVFSPYVIAMTLFVLYVARRVYARTT